MDLSEMDELDGMIDEALGGEPMRAVPAGFHRKLENRLRVTALVKQERQGFRFRMVASGLLFAVLGFVVVGVPAIAFYQGWVVRSVPGAMGYFDYLVVFALQSWDKVVLALGIAVVAAVAATMVGVVVPFIRHRAQRQH